MNLDLLCALPFIVIVLYIGGALQVAKVCQVLQVDDKFCMKRKWTSRRD